MSAIRNRFLIIGTDEAVEGELRDACDSVGMASATVEFAQGHRRGLELAISRQPRVILVQATQDLDAAKKLLSSLRESCPDSICVATFSRELFSGGLGEEAFFVQGMRAGFADFLRRPIAAEELAGVLKNASTKDAPDVVRSRRGTVVAMVSNKGGVGKSTAAVNLAATLARKYPEEVLLIDTSTQMGVCASMLGLEPETTITDAARSVDRLDGVLLRELSLYHDSGLHVLAAPTDALESVEITDERMTRILTVARNSFRHVVVDTFPLFDRLVVSVLDYVDAAYIVLDNSVPTVVGCKQFLGLLDQISFPAEARRIVMNRFEKSAGYPSRKQVETQLGAPVDYVLPSSKRVAAGTNIGEPTMLRPGLGNRWAGKMKQLAGDVDRLNTPDGAATSRASSSDRSNADTILAEAQA
ncbi:MAG: AAA family ATPase [Planctomycetota bacterium]